MFGDKKTTWILVADRAKVKIYEWFASDKRLETVLNFEDGDARKPDRNLKADRPGHGHREGASSRYAIDEKTSYKEHSSQAFLKTIAGKICANDISSRFDMLVVIAQHEVYDTLGGYFSAEVRDKITLHCPKDLTNMPQKELEDYYNEKLI